MENQFCIKKMVTPEEIEAFWLVKKEYDRQDIFPNLEEEGEELEEIIQWFESEDYYNTIMDLHENFIGIGSELQFAFFLDDTGEYIGFIMYKIYTHEDGKCFICDFCIKKDYRNKRIGTHVIKFFEEYVQQNESVKYFELNASNKDNARFWKRMEYVESETDEYGVVVYRKSNL